MNTIMVSKIQTKPHNIKDLQNKWRPGTKYHVTYEGNQMLACEFRDRQCLKTGSDVVMHINVNPRDSKWNLAYVMPGC